MKKLMLPLVCALLLITAAFRSPLFVNTALPDGAWEKRTGDVHEVLLFADGYFTHTVYNKNGRRFVRTRGGTLSMQGNRVLVLFEFDTDDKDAIGKTVLFTGAISANTLSTNIGGAEGTWVRVDAGSNGLSGLWAITARRQEGSLVPIHQTGTRKTVKILSATRFQWAAIDPGTKSFMGTGGGTYTFQNGKYTEHIEFFSRDSSRVGNSLSFDGKLEGGDWHHSGLSSRGEPIYEVWSRKKIRR